MNKKLILFLIMLLFGSTSFLRAEVVTIGEGTEETYRFPITNTVQIERDAVPEAITALAPADGATGLEGNIVLTWEGGANATHYQVLFGTSPVNIPVVLDWTLIDDNYGSFDVTDLVVPNTQYFWQIKAKNSDGTVSTARRGFTTALIAPSDVTASEEEIFVGDTTLIKWKFSGIGGFTGELTVADGTEMNPYVPVYGIWADAYTRSEMIYPAEMLEDMTGGDITSLTFYLGQSAGASWEPDVFQVYFQEVDATTLSSYYTDTDAQISYTGYLDGTGATMTINLDAPYRYNGGNLLIGIQEIEKGSYSGASFYGMAATGASASGYNGSSLANIEFNQRNFLPKVTFTCGGNKGSRAINGFNVYYGDVKANTELITERKYNLANLSYEVENGYNVTVTAVYDEGESEKSDPVVVKVSGYGTLTGVVTELISGDPIADVKVKFSGQDEFQNNVAFEGITDANGEYTINNVKAGNYTGTATKEGMGPNTSDPVTLAYDGEESVNFVLHETYNPVYKVFAQELDSATVEVMWSLNDFVTPGSGLEGDSFTEGFEGGIPADWTTIDADGDGYNWMQSSVMMAGYSITPHSGNDMVSSASYSGVALFPDNYLVTPQVNIANGSTFSFWACAQDASYPAEHFGVAISDDGTTFTVVEEWTMTAKGNGAKGPRGTNDTGNYYQYSVDLSAYAGQKYIAIRHFNCTDMFYLNVDDVELSTSKGTRDVAKYAVFRKAILKENELVAADSLYFGLVAAPDTLYTDSSWNGVEPGLYQYGVSAVYPGHPEPPYEGKGNRDEVIIGAGAVTDNKVPTYNLYNYSCTNQIYTGDEIGGAGTINSIAFRPNAVTATSRNLEIYMVNTDKTSFASGSDWVSVTNANLVYSGSVAWTTDEWSTIELTVPFEFDGSNLCIVVNDITGTWTTSNLYYADEANDQALYIYQDTAPYNPTESLGTGTKYGKKNQIKLDITYDGGQGNDNPVTPITWSNVLSKDMTTVVTVSATLNDASSADGVEVRFHNEFEQTDDIVVILDETGTYTFEEFRKGEYTLTFNLEGYESDYVNTPVSIWADLVEFTGVLNEIYNPVNSVTASRSGYVSWDAVIPVDKIAVSYKVKLDDEIYSEPVENFIQIAEEDLTIGQTYEVGVAVVYTTGMSDYTTASFTYTDCSDASQQVEELTATNVPGNTNVTLAWNGTTPTPPIPPTPPTGNMYSFEGSMEGWTTIDADGDGFNWQNASVLQAGFQIPAHEGEDCLSSQSYDFDAGALTPDNYLVSPSKAEYTAISFWACAQDPDYAAEHFGVAVSTAGNTSASDFTTVQEWTMTAKSAGKAGNYASRSREGREGAWYEYTVDLSAYAGQEIWVAIRHFNSTDMFYINVDEVTLATPDAKLANAGTGFGMIDNAMTKDGNWYFYDDGTNNDAIGLTSGGGFYWGVMFPAGTFEGNRLTKVAYFDYAAHTGTVSIYQGGTSAPETLLHSQPYNVSGTGQYIEIEMTEAVQLDDAQNVWVVMHNNDGQYVASIDSSTGVNNGSCISTDGATWYTTVSAASSGNIDGNWNLRAYIETGSGPAPSGLVANKYNIYFDGELVGATASSTFTYDAGDFEEHEYVVVWVDSDYLVSCVDENNTIHYTALLNVDENEVVNSIYPNPTSGDLHINATAMTRISIVNTLGQVVYEQEVSADEMVIDMAKYEAGVYMVNIYTENGSSVKRVTVVK